MYAFTETIYIQLEQTEEREALRKQGLNEKTAASVLLKLFEEDTVYQDPFDFCTESTRKPMIYDSGL